MAKDGTNRGGARPGAGAKKKPLADKIMEGNPGKRNITVIQFDNAAELEGQEMPKPSEMLSAVQKDGKTLEAAEIYKKTWEWLHERGCSSLISPQVLERYAMSAARWIQCEEAVTEYGFLAKHPTTGNAMQSPYVAMGQNYMTQTILSNEKYKGDVLLQKEFTVDFLQKKVKKNEGEVPQYYIQGNHDAIISPEVFDLVQAEIAKRLNGPTRYSGLTIFSCKIKCADCGCWYGKKIWHSNDKYRKFVYRCNHKYKGKKCETPFVLEEEIQAAFVSAYNKLMAGKKQVLANAEMIRKTVCETEALKEEKGRLAEQMSVLAGMMQKIAAANAHVAQDQDEYRNHYNELVKQYDETKERYDKVVADISDKEMRRVTLVHFTKELKAQHGPIHVFDCGLWTSLIDFVTVSRNKEITVTFKDGTEILA